MRIPILAALLFLLASHPTLAAVPSTVAIGTETSDINPKLAAEVQDGLEPEILYGLSEVFSILARSKVVLSQVSDPSTIARIRGCDDASCLQNVAKSAGVDLVVQVRLQMKKPLKRGKPEYVLSMLLARDTPSRDFWREKTDCQACAASEIRHMASLLASTIAGQMKIDIPPPAPPPAPKLSETAAKPEPIETPAPTEVKPEWSVPRYLSVTAMIGGAALAGTGIYLLTLDGKGSCDLATSKEQCPERYKTKVTGTSLLVGGGLVAVAGLVGAIFFGPKENAGVSIGFSGSSVSLTGAF